MSDQREHSAKLDLCNTFEQAIGAIAGGAVIAILMGITAEAWLGGVIGLAVALVLYFVALHLDPLERCLLVVGWVIINNWQLLVGLGLLVGVARGAFVLFNDPWAPALVVAFAFAIMLFAWNYPQLPPRRRIALQSCHKKYVRAVDGGRSVIDGNGALIDTWEQFELVNVGFGKVTLKTWHGQYVQVDSDTAELVAPSRRWSRRAVFELVEVGGGKVALRGYNGRYMCAESGDAGHRIVVDRESLGEWEKFTMEHVPRKK